MERMHHWVRDTTRQSRTTGRLSFRIGKATLSFGVVRNATVRCYLTADKWQETPQYRPMRNTSPIYVLNMGIGVALSYGIFRLNPSLLCHQRRYRVSHPHGTKTVQCLLTSQRERSKIRTTMDRTETFTLSIK